MFVGVFVSREQFQNKPKNLGFADWLLNPPPPQQTGRKRCGHFTSPGKEKECKACNSKVLIYSILCKL